MISFSTDQLKKTSLKTVLDCFAQAEKKLWKILVKLIGENISWICFYNFTNFTSSSKYLLKEQKEMWTYRKLVHKRFWHWQILVSWYISKRTMLSTRPALNFAIDMID